MFVQSNPKKKLDKCLTIGVSYTHMSKEAKHMDKRKNFFMTDLQIKRLQTMSKKTGLSESEILRRAIDEYWERYERKAKEIKR
jgi:hypothetical protein